MARHSFGLPGFGELGRLRRSKYNLPGGSGKTPSRYYENDDVSKRVHKLAFSIVNCFGSQSQHNSFGFKFLNLNDGKGHNIYVIKTGL